MTLRMLTCSVSTRHKIADQLKKKAITSKRTLRVLKGARSRYFRQFQH